jgi:hypothetical protein
VLAALAVAAASVVAAALTCTSIYALLVPLQNAKNAKISYHITITSNL